MKSVCEKIFSDEAMRRFVAAHALVESIPRNDAYFEEATAREIARAIGEKLGLAVVDGTYGGVAHTWLVVPEATPAGAGILDVYAVGSLPMVRLLDGWAGLPHASVYQPGEDASVDVDFDMVASLLDVLGGARLVANG